MYLGIDASLTSTGIVVLDENSEVMIERALDYNVAHELPKKTPLTAEIEVMDWQMNEFENIISDIVIRKNMPITVAAIETPFSGFNQKVFAQLAGLGMMMRRELWLRNVPTVLIIPTQLKKWVGVSPKAKGSTKSKVKKGTQDIYGYTHSCSDIVDAYVMAKIAQARKNQTLCRSSEQREILGKLKWVE